MNIKRLLSKGFLLAAVFLAIAAVSTSSVADESRGKKGDRGKWTSQSESAGVSESDNSPKSFIDDPRAITKEGFLGQVDRGYVSLKTEGSRRIATYRLEEDYRVTYDNDEYWPLYGDDDISLDVIPPSSIVKLVLIEGQVREIILLLRSS